MQPQPTNTPASRLPWQMPANPVVSSPYPQYSLPMAPQYYPMIQPYGISQNGAMPVYGLAAVPYTQYPYQTPINPQLMSSQPTMGYGQPTPALNLSVPSSTPTTAPTTSPRQPQATLLDMPLGIELPSRQQPQQEESQPQQQQAQPQPQPPITQRQQMQQHGPQRIPPPPKNTPHVTTTSEPSRSPTFAYRNDYNSLLRGDPKKATLFGIRLPSRARSHQQLNESREDELRGQYYEEPERRAAPLPAYRPGPMPSVSLIGSVGPDVVNPDQVRMWNQIQEHKRRADEDLARRMQQASLDDRSGRTTIQTATCRMCEIQLEISQLANHKANECLLREVHCGVCGIGMAAVLLTEHALTCKKQATPLPPIKLRDGRVMCPYCSKAFRNEEEEQVHLLTTCTESNFK